jgi:cephalosporin-C deacetylase-like acetyl esterase
MTATFQTFQTMVVKYLKESNDDDPGIFDSKFRQRVKRSKTYQKMEQVFEKENLQSDLSQCLQLYFDGAPKV